MKESGPGCSCHEFPPGLYLSPWSQPVWVGSSGRRDDFEELKHGCMGDIDSFSQGHGETALGRGRGGGGE